MSGQIDLNEYAREANYRREVCYMTAQYGKYALWIMMDIGIANCI